MIFEILVGRNTPSIGETFAESLGPLRQMGYVPRPCPIMVFFARFWANQKLFFLSEW